MSAAMRPIAIVLVVVAACSAEPQTKVASSNVPSSAPGANDPGVDGTDAGAAATDGGVAGADAGTTADACPAADAGSPDAGTSYGQGVSPSVSRQSVGWSSTGAAGCKGLVPATVSPRLSFTPPRLWAERTAVDGQGNLTLAWDRSAPYWDVQRAYFPADGSAGAVVSGRGLFLAARERGFLIGDIDQSSSSERAHAYGPDGTDEGYLGEPISILNGSFWPDPRGGFVQTRTTTDPIWGHTFTYELRWVDATLQARTVWWPVTTWNYPYNVDDTVLVDGSGKALVLIFFDPPMSMPCPGDLSFDAWVAEDGSVAPLQTPPPKYKTDLCDLAGGVYGLPLALDDGFVFYFPPGLNAPVAGWWAWFRSGQTGSEPPPAWLSQYGSTLRHLPNGSYLSAVHDPATCGRTAELIGPSGQLCATLPLDGSADCSGADALWPDGTFSISDGCTITWWPGLGRAR
jgi:hypothetical protein